ncbi:MAG: anthranilate synthase component I family protein [Tepidisphaeraceae bacterium]
MNAAPTWQADIDRPEFVLVADARQTRLTCHGVVVRTWPGPLDALSWLERSWTELRLDPSQRWIGHFSYEFGRLFEDLPDRRGTASPVLYRFGIGSNTDRPSPDVTSSTTFAIERSHTRIAYTMAAQRAIDYIAAGDVFQINLAQTFRVHGIAASPREVYARMQQHTPAAFAAFQQFDDVALLSNSPELFFRIEPQSDGSRHIINRPIKGTRPRGPGMREELEASSKDKAELAMIVDLQRNDLGRVCEIGSVRVVEPRAIEEHPTLYHGVATIDGTLRRDATLVDVLRAVFPCGSITGCPKIRAMQIIDELEPWPRNEYCGALGSIGSDGSAEFNVAIRTMIHRAGVYEIAVGSGIVADSGPDAEYYETIVKARAMFAALGLNADQVIEHLDHVDG